MRRLALIGFFAFALAGCNTPRAGPRGRRAGLRCRHAAQFQIARGRRRAADIARYRAIQDNDLAMGHVAQSVYDQVKKEIASAESACSAGRDAEARALVLASRKRHGYPTSL